MILASVCLQSGIRLIMIAAAVADHFLCDRSEDRSEGFDLVDLAYYGSYRGQHRGMLARMAVQIKMLASSSAIVLAAGQP